MTFQRPAHYFRGKNLVWFPGGPGVRYRVRLADPVQRDSDDRLLFEIIDGPHAGQVMGIDCAHVTGYVDQANGRWGE